MFSSERQEQNYLMWIIKTNDVHIPMFTVLALDITNLAGSLKR